MILKKNYFAIALIIFSFFSFAQNVSAGYEHKFKGYAGSDGAGGISFNCTNDNSCGTVDYGVTSNPDGSLSGHAGSDALGGLYFGHYAGLDRARIDTVIDSFTGTTNGVLSGNAQFLSADGNGGNGRVSLSGSIPGYDNYGPVVDLVSTFEFDGYAGGSSVVGWVDFNTDHSEVTYDPFYFLFSTVGSLGLSEGNKVDYNGSVTLEGVTVDSDGRCTATNGNFQGRDSSPYSAGKSPAPAARKTIDNLTTNTLFSLECQNGAGHKITRDLNILVKTPSPTITFTADDTNVSAGSSTYIRGTTYNVENCNASGAWTGSKADNDSEEVFPNNPASFYQLECQNLNQIDYPGNTNGAITIFVEAPEVILSAANTNIPFGDKIKFSYQTEFVNGSSCVATGDVPDGSGLSINTNPGAHDFETTDPVTSEGATYWARLTCDDTNGIPISDTIEFRVGKNPLFREF